MAETEQISESEQQENKDYNLKQLKCDLLDMCVDFCFLGIFAAFFAADVRNWIVDSLGITSAALGLCVFFLVMTAIHYLVSFPLSVYSGHVLEKQYGLTNMSAGKWLMRHLGKASLVMALGLPLMLGLFLTIWWGGAYWWLIATAAAYLVSMVLGQLFPVVFLPIFYKVERLDDDELSSRLERLSEGTGLDIQGVYRLGLSVETKKANAMLAGLGRTRRVILGDTLLDEFEPAEIEVVFAHEVGHHVFRHIFKFMILGLLLSGAGFFICDQMLRALHGGIPDYANLSYAVLPWMTLVLSVVSFFLGPIQNAISRHFERQCDNYALQRTQDPNAYRSAFTKLARLNKADPDPHPLEVFFFHDHPPIAERLAMADGVGHDGR